MLIPPVAIYRIGACAAILAGIGYFSFIASYTLNIPFGDDYPDALGFLTAYNQASSIQEKWLLLFSKNNSHVTFTNHLVYLAMQAFTGEINFRWLPWIGSLNILGIAAALYA
ncbi:MAG: hypothetical protein EP312_11440, partial [Gammaproteobacteria bacterium]